MLRYDQGIVKIQKKKKKRETLKTFYFNHVYGSLTGKHSILVCSSFFFFLAPGNTYNPKDDHKIPGRMHSCLNLVWFGVNLWYFQCKYSFQDRGVRGHTQVKREITKTTNMDWKRKKKAEILSITSVEISLKKNSHNPFNLCKNDYDFKSIQNDNDSLFMLYQGSFTLRNWDYRSNGKIQLKIHWPPETRHDFNWSPWIVLFP